MISNKKSYELIGSHFKMTEERMTEERMTEERMTVNKEELFDIEHEQYIETPWNIIESYFRGQHLERFVRHQFRVVASPAGVNPQSLRLRWK